MTETREIREQVPCGEVVTTQTVEAGKVVRQDCTVFVTKGFKVIPSRGKSVARTSQGKVTVTPDDENATHP